MSLRLLQVLIVVVACAVARADDLPAAARWTGTNDVLVRRAFIPTESNRHGEVREVTRDGARVVQTLLYSVSLKRGLQAIREKEASAWPPDQPNHADSAAYLALLDEAEQTVFATPPDPADPRRKLLMEVVDLGATAYVAMYAPDVDGDGDTLDLRGAVLLGARPVSIVYAQRAMNLMTTGAFAERERDDVGLEP